MAATPSLLTRKTTKKISRILGWGVRLWFSIGSGHTLWIVIPNALRGFMYSLANVIAYRPLQVLTQSCPPKPVGCEESVSSKWAQQAHSANHLMLAKRPATDSEEVVSNYILFWRILFCVSPCTYARFCLLVAYLHHWNLYRLLYLFCLLAFTQDEHRHVK